MRVLIACVLLAACVTGSGASPPQRVVGCWANRETRATTTMRWVEDAQRPGTFLGTKNNYGAAAGSPAERYTLEQQTDGWRICQQPEQSGDARCWGVAQGERGSLEGGRVFIDGSGDALRITLMGDGPERTIFQGRREGCR